MLAVTFESILVTNSLVPCGTFSLSLLGGYRSYYFRFSWERLRRSADLLLRLERLDRLEPLEGLRASRLPLRFSGEPDFLRFLRSAGLLLCDDGITI